MHYNYIYQFVEIFSDINFNYENFFNPNFGDSFKIHN